MNFQRILCLSLMIVVLFSCREDFESNEIIPQTFSPEVLSDFEGEVDLITGSVRGIVVDQEENPIPNVFVVLNDNQTSTDEFGHFFFTDIFMNAEGTVVKVKIADFHTSSKLFYPQADATENLEIMLTRIESEDELSGLAAGEVDLDGNTSFSYPEDAFLNEDGSLYEGSVFINSTFISASDEDFFKMLPGNFQAVDIKNQLVGLMASQLLQIIILDDNGNTLKINKDAAPTLRFAQSIDVDSDAWYYAEEQGLYTINTEREDQTISFKNNTPILIAESASTTSQLLTLNAADGTTLLENMEVEILSRRQEVVFRGLSNDQGQIQFNNLERGEGILRIIDACGQIVHNESAVTNNADLTLDQVSTEVVAGEVYTCEVDPSTDNVIRVLQGTRTNYFYQDDSQFALTLQTCAEGMAVIAALDDSSADLSNLAPMDIDMLASDIELFTCADPAVNQLRVINSDTGEEFIFDITSTEGSAPTITSFENFDQVGKEFLITFNGSEVGDYSAQDANEIETLFDESASLRVSGDADVFIVSRFGGRDSDNITIGNFEGTFENAITNENIKLEGKFNFYFQ